MRYTATWAGYIPPLLLVLLVSCTPVVQIAPSPAPTPHICGPFAVATSSASIACIEQENGLLLQSVNSESVSLLWANGSVTFSGTILYYPYPTNQSLTETITTLDGTTLVSVSNQTRIVPVGAQVILSLSDARMVQNVSPQPLPYDAALVEAALLTQLPQPIRLPTPIAPPDGYVSSSQQTSDSTPCPVTSMCSATNSQASCTVRDEWEEARVQPGETLSSIATRFGVSAADLQIANCLNNPNRLQIGQILHVPPYATATPLTMPTLTPSIVAFRADNSTLVIGDCTTLRWDVQNISAIFLDEQPQSGSGVLPICPPTTTTYRLRVVYPDGTQSQHPLMISVLEGTP